MLSYKMITKKCSLCQRDLIVNETNYNAKSGSRCLTCYRLIDNIRKKMKGYVTKGTSEHEALEKAMESSFKGDLDESIKSGVSSYFGSSIPTSSTGTTGGTDVSDVASSLKQHKLLEKMEEMKDRIASLEESNEELREVIVKTNENIFEFSEGVKSIYGHFEELKESFKKLVSERDRDRIAYNNYILGIERRVNLHLKMYPVPSNALKPTVTYHGYHIPEVGIGFSAKSPRDPRR